MINKKTALSTSIILALGLSMPAFAETKAAEGATTEDGTVVEIECVPQTEVDLMTAEAKANLTLPICEVEVEEKKVTEEKVTEEKAPEEPKVEVAQ